MTALTASTVSRVLRASGERPLASGTSRMREGVRVSQSGPRVRVTADLNSDRAARRRAEDCADILVEAGYVIDWTDERTALYVIEKQAR